MTSNSRCNLCIGLSIAALACFNTIALAWDEPPKVDGPDAGERFDHTVREDFFAGFNGDEEALNRAMEACEEVLKEKPEHAEAMVWLGGGEMFLSGQKFNKGNMLEGMKLWKSSLERMNKAEELEPNNIGVLIPRAAVLLPAARNAPASMSGPVLESVLKSFERVYELQKGSLAELGEHPLGELRMGLADTYRLKGELDKSKIHLEAVLKELPDTEYATEAEKWLSAKSTEKLAHNCIGCHSK